MMWYYWVLLGILSFTKSLLMEQKSASITWAHGVNEKARLKISLNSDIDMLEADILMGRLADGKETEIPIMAHPPNDISDLSLMEFLTIVDDFNKMRPLKKGIKLDFKSIAAFESAVRNEAFTMLLSRANYPVWLNADILSGPLAHPQIKPVEASRFLKGAKLFPNSVLSLGWTTGFNDTEKVGYTDSHIEEMLRILDLHEVNQTITFAVRAGLVAESKSQITSLLRNNTHTLTIWSSVNDDGFDVAKLNAILDDVGSSRVYIDVPNKLKIQLNLLKTVNNTNVVRS